LRLVQRIVVEQRFLAQHPVHRAGPAAGLLVPLFVLPAATVAVRLVVVVVVAAAAAAVVVVAVVAAAGLSWVPPLLALLVQLSQSCSGKTVKQQSRAQSKTTMN
jgi:hypothetical protein